MSSLFVYGGGLWLIGGAGVLGWALCRAAAHGDRQLERAREQLGAGHQVDHRVGGGFVVTPGFDDGVHERIMRWALEDGHRTPGFDEQRAQHDVRPYGGLCEIVPMDELRRRRDSRDGAA